MIQTILTIYDIRPLQVIALLVVLALFVGVFIANRMILRRMRRHARQSSFISRVVQEALSAPTDESNIREAQREEQILADKFKLIFEQSITGMSFYSPDGYLLDANKIMREICHFDSDVNDAFFSKVNMFDLPPFNELVNRNHVEELWVCYQSIIPERNIHDYLEIHLHPICDDQGNVIYLSVAARNITEERELYLQNKLNDNSLRQANEEIKQYESELRYLMENCQMQPWRIKLKENTIEFYKDLTTIDKAFTLEQLQAFFYNQDNDFVRSMVNPAETISKPVSWVGQMNPVVTGKYSEPQWVQINSIPEYDDDGQLKGSFGIWRNIQGLMQKQEQLKRETERANDSGHQKSVFLANMTHEIRTPLNAIVGFSDLLQAMNQPEEKRELIRIIHNNCDMLLRLINDILVLSSVDSTGLQLIPERVDFSSEFDTVCLSLAQRVENPAVEFQKDNPLPSLIVNIDNRRLQQVITNFVTNAVKNTQQGHIRVGYRVEDTADGQSIYVYCEDTGSGIPKEAQARIFERFVKLNDFVQGTGLGLSICKAIVEKCGGEIGVDSEVGRGSTFWFRIPLTSEE